VKFSFAERYAHRVFTRTARAQVRQSRTLMSVTLACTTAHRVLKASKTKFPYCWLLLGGTFVILSSLCAEQAWNFSTQPFCANGFRAVFSRSLLSRSQIRVPQSRRPSHAHVRAVAKVEAGPEAPGGKNAANPTLDDGELYFRMYRVDARRSIPIIDPPVQDAIART